MKYCLVLAFFFIAAAGSSAAPQGMLTADPAPSSPRLRWNAPITVLWNVHWNGSSILEGHFELTYTDGRRTICESRSHDMVLSPGAQTVRLGLPTAGSFVSWSQDEVTIRFVTEKETYDLGRYPLMGRSGSRSLNVCICGSVRRLDATQDAFIQSLRFGALLNEQQSPIATVNTHWERDDMPDTPIYYCGFDIVVLTAEEFVHLRQKQLAAILKWVRAGGSVCVFIDKNLELRYVEFLNALLADSVEPSFLLDSTGNLTVDVSQQANGMWLAPCELGRSAVIDLDAVSALPDLRLHARSLSTFLWKIRKELVDSLVQRSSTSAQVRRQRRSNNNYQQLMVWQGTVSVGQFLERLMPNDVRVVPTSLIALMLLGYLFVIGPVDYFLLGYFRLRRFTWLTFPLATVAVALLCVKVSEVYLSSKNTGNNLVVRDVGADGSVLRENRFQLIFRGSRGTVDSEVRNEIFTPLNQERLSLNSQYAYQYQYANRPISGSPSQAPRYSGLIPLRYDVRQTIEQWKPQVNRYFAIAPEQQTDFDWDRYSQVTTNAGRNKLREDIQKRWPGASVIIVHGSETRRIAGPSVFRRQTLPRDNLWLAYRRPSLSEDQFLLDICHRGRQGFFQLVSQLSPNGGDNFDDLAVLDESDLAQWLLVIAVEEGDDIVLYRRLYRGADQ